MKKILGICIVVVWATGFTNLQAQSIAYYKGPVVTDNEVLNGAEDMPAYLPLLAGKRVAVVANQTSVIGKTHLVDTLLKLKVNVVKIFAPEHGFRGMGDAGEHIKNSVDSITGKKVVSLYGKTSKPDSLHLADVDVVVFDIQDVGARFYTYVSTLTDMMEACARYKKQLIVLDRPNPNGFYVDGAVLDTTHKSYVGMHPVPVVHGLTIGEFANMINGENWLKDSLQCNVTVVPCKSWNHTMLYQLPIAPSPNLKTMQAVYLYPSLCLFEGTSISVGRGTKTPFEMYGSPDLTLMPNEFVPKSGPGSKKPMHMDKLCFGENLHYNVADKGAAKFTLHYILKAYTHTSNADNFFGKNTFFEKLCGSTDLRCQIAAGETEDEIRAVWKSIVDDFKLKRKKYLLYTDFE